MRKNSRKHHFVPQFYLAGFTESDKTEGFLWVSDLETRKQWRSRPNAVGYQKDFYRVECLDEPQSIEVFLADFEDKAARVLQGIATQHTLPDNDEDMAYLVNFVALMAVRVPGVRDAFSAPWESIYKHIMAMSVRTSERWDSVLKFLREKGVEIPPGVTYETMKKWVESGECEIRIPQNWHLHSFLLAAKKLVEILALRQWSLFMVEEGGGSLVCSDSPVSVIWMSPELNNPMFPPAFGQPLTEVAMPLDRQTLMIGHFEGSAQMRTATAEMVANLNARTILHTERFVYSPEKDIRWLLESGGIGGIDELWEYASRRHGTLASRAKPPETEGTL